MYRLVTIHSVTDRQTDRQTTYRSDEFLMQSRGVTGGLKI